VRIDNRCRRCGRNQIIEDRQFERVVQQRAGPVGVNQIDGFVAQCGRDDMPKCPALRVHASQVCGIGTDCKPVDRNAIALIVRCGFEHQRRRGLAHEESGPALIERPAPNPRRRQHTEPGEARQE
jgi:hypothetical protein